jgi:hypothetical protein
MERIDSMRAVRTVIGVAVFAVAIAATARPAAAQACDQEASNACGFVWNDANHNGIQDDGETGIADVTVTFTLASDSTVSYTATTGICEGFDEYGNPASVFTCGVYHIRLEEPGTYNITINPTSIAQGTTATVPNATTDDLDSDGENDTNTGLTIVKGVVVESFGLVDTDFGFYTSAVQIGTGTPGYWKNHPDDWPVSSIMMGGKSYSVEQAIDVLKKVSKDKAVTLFSSLLAAKLNLLSGTNPDCIATTVGLADKWLAKYPVGTPVAGSSAAWAAGEPLHKDMDAYNNGLACAPHRN